MHGAYLDENRASLISTWRWTAIAFVYWLLLVCALTPGNVRALVDAGFKPDWGREAVRVLAAGVLGASVTPFLLILARRFPIEADRRWRNLGAQTLSLAVISPMLILTSCMLAAWLFDGKFAPSSSVIIGQLYANMLLLTLWLGLLLGAIQLFRHAGAVRDSRREWPNRITITERGRFVVVPLNDVEWIETQGNYQALHTSDATHLLRETSTMLAARLDPSKFVRIHRRHIVAVAKIRHIEPLSNGDAIVTLANGTEVRQSRRYHRALKATLSS
jgi:hypothetical protein